MKHFKVVEVVPALDANGVVHMPREGQIVFQCRRCHGISQVATVHTPEMHGRICFPSTTMGFCDECEQFIQGRSQRWLQVFRLEYTLSFACS